MKYRISLYMMADVVSSYLVNGDPYPPPPPPPSKCGQAHVSFYVNNILYDFRFKQTSAVVISRYFRNVLQQLRWNWNSHSGSGGQNNVHQDISQQAYASQKLQDWIQEEIWMNEQLLERERKKRILVQFYLSKVFLILTLSVLYHTIPHELCRCLVKDVHGLQSFVSTHSEESDSLLFILCTQ